ncbi:MAG: Zn-dependent oxidoreductase [Nitriliruptor sp.]|nr:MAG: Zn-dependent oxidoreductase [Nitriliruptor sp.]
MLAALLTGHGGPEQLEVRDDVPVPRPARGEVLVQVTAAAVNNTDLWTREGAYGREGDPHAVAGWKGVPLDFPRIQGGDVVGIVTAVGSEVDEAVVGRRVLLDPTRYADDGDEPTLEAVLGSEQDGGFAEYVVIAADQAHDVTDSPLSDEQLACLPIAYGTATGMLERAQVRVAETVVVTGASGGVGLALVQLAHARGAHVIALTSADHAAAVRDAGASHTVAREGGSVADRIREAAGGPIAVVADVVGGWVFEQLLPLLATGGRWVTCGAVADPLVSLDLRTLYLHRRRLIGSTMHTPAQFRRLVADARHGRIDPKVARTYPLTQIHTAQADFVEGGHAGKLVLRPGAGGVST